MGTGVQGEMRLMERWERVLRVILMGVSVRVFVGLLMEVVARVDMRGRMVFVPRGRVQGVRVMNRPMICCDSGNEFRK